MKYIKELAVALIFILGVALFYGNTLQNGFIHDDHGQVVDNNYIQSLKYLPKVITGCIWESAVGNCKETYYYRPLQSLSYMLTYQISSNPLVFHLINLIYYTTIICLIFILVKILTKNTFIAFFSALIFLIHPLNSEVVNWIATVPELLYTIFILSATIFYLLYRQKKNSKYLKFVYIFFTLGIFSKEPAVFVPFIFLTLDLVFFKQKIKSILTWKNIKPYLIFIILFALYMALRTWVLGGLGQDSSVKRTVFQQIWIFFDLFGSYIKKVIWPIPLNLFYTFNPSYKILDLNFLTNVLVTIGFFGACFWAKKKQLSLIFFSLIWFFVFLSPSLLFVNSIGENLFAERHVFASTIGFSILVAVMVEWLWRNEAKWKTGLYVIAGIIIVLSLAAVYSRNILWKSDELIYIDTLTKSPDADLIHYNLAYLYDADNKTALAKEQYGEIIKRGTWVGLYKAYNNLGNISRLEKNYGQAIAYYEASVKNNPNHREALNNLGALSLEQGDVLTSVTSLCKALQIDPNFKNANTNFDAAAKQIQGLDNKSFISLYDQLLNGSIFKPNNSTITLKNKDCSYPQGCILIFSSTLPKTEFLFPFLTVGKTAANEIVRTRYFEFNPETSEIAVGIDKQFEMSKIHFWLPSCNGTYYETSSN